MNSKRVHCRVHEENNATSKPVSFHSIGRGGAIRTPDPLRPRELSRFQGVHRFSAIPNIYNNPGNLLSLKKQPQQIEWIARQAPKHREMLRASPAYANSSAQWSLREWKGERPQQSSGQGLASSARPHP